MCFPRRYEDLTLDDQFYSVGIVKPGKPSNARQLAERF
jgi:hypothetical protein